MAFFCKEKKLSQAELGKFSGINERLIGKYEKYEIKPPINTSRKMANILEVSLDYLASKNDEQVVKSLSTRILEVLKFEEQYHNHIFSVIYAFIAKRKIQSIL